MGMILHDWNLEGKMHLISAAYDALPEGGAFVVIENLIDDARRENAFGLMMSLNMLIEFGDAFDFTGARLRRMVSRGGLPRRPDHATDRPGERRHRLQIVSGGRQEATGAEGRLDAQNPLGRGTHVALARGPGRSSLGRDEEAIGPQAFRNARRAALPPVGWTN